MDKTLEAMITEARKDAGHRTGSGSSSREIAQGTLVCVRAWIRTNSKDQEQIIWRLNGKKLTKAQLAAL